jgi:rubrerythrin
MPDSPERVPRPITPLKISSPSDATASNADKMLCERCGAEMYRMHAVWRCPACGFKTDCCGW